MNCGFITDLETRNGTFHIASALMMNYVWNLAIAGVKIRNSSGWGLYGYSVLGKSNVSYLIITGGHHFGEYSGGNLHLKYYNSCSDAELIVRHSHIENGVENSNNKLAYAGGIDIYLRTNYSINLKMLHYKTTADTMVGTWQLHIKQSRNTGNIKSHFTIALLRMVWLVKRVRECMLSWSCLTLTVLKWVPLNKTTQY